MCQCVYACVSACMHVLVRGMHVLVRGMHVLVRVCMC